MEIKRNELRNIKMAKGDYYIYVRCFDIERAYPNRYYTPRAAWKDFYRDMRYYKEIID